MPEPALSSALVRILGDDADPRQPVGAGFLVSPRHILTCSHVVADALRISRGTPTAPADRVWLDVPLLAGAVPVQARVLVWYPMKDSAMLGEREDIAVLELDRQALLPSAALPIPLVVLQMHAFFDRPVRMCGFPAGMDAGDWVSGQLQGPMATGWV